MGTGQLGVATGLRLKTRNEKMWFPLFLEMHTFFPPQGGPG
jgi:hypothetical protein